MAKRVFKIAATALILCAAEAIAASDTGLVATMSVPGNPLDNFDIGAVDQAAGRYYLADRSNAGIDIFDTMKRSYIGRVTGFVGIKRRPDGSAANAMSGPNGVALDMVRHELWVGDGDSTVKVIDIASVPAKLVATVSTGGQGRADELTVDEKDGIVAVGNNADRPTYVVPASTD